MPQYGEVRIDYITYTTGVSPNEANRTVTVSSLIGNPTFTGDVIISGDLDVGNNVYVSGNTILSGTLTVTGDTVLNDLTVTGIGQIDELYVSGNATITGNTNISGNTDIRGNVTVTGTQYVLGEAEFGGDVYISGAATVTGNISGEADGGVYGSGYWKIPDGTTAERPTIPVSGMIRYNTSLERYEGYGELGWDLLGGGATGSGEDRVFILNEQTVNNNYTIPDQHNATSCGPITIVDSIEVVIGDGENWSIV